jgi:hypothetical protein
MIMCRFLAAGNPTVGPRALEYLVSAISLKQGRNLRMIIHVTIENPTLTLEKMEDVFQAWWNAWYNETLADFVVKPPKWYRSGPAIQVGDIFGFQKRPEEQKISTPIWSINRVIQMVPATIDGLIHEVVVEYKNTSEKVFRTRRAARSVATLSKEEDLDLTQKLSAASREATKELLMREPVAAHVPMEADGWS